MGFLIYNFLGKLHLNSKGTRSPDGSNLRNTAQREDQGKWGHLRDITGRLPVLQNKGWPDSSVIKNKQENSVRLFFFFQSFLLYLRRILHWKKLLFFRLIWFYKGKNMNKYEQSQFTSRHGNFSSRYFLWSRFNYGFRLSGKCYHVKIVSSVKPLSYSSLLIRIMWESVASHAVSLAGTKRVTVPATSNFSAKVSLLWDYRCCLLLSQRKSSKLPRETARHMKKELIGMSLG